MTMQFAARGVLLFTLALATMGAARNDGLTALLARMRAASGPVWRAHVVSTSYVTIRGEPVALSSDADGVDLLLRECSGALCTGTFFDGSQIFSVDMNGSRFLQERDPQTYLRGVRMMDSLEFLDPDFSAAGGAIADGGSRRYQGAEFRVLLVTAPDTTPMEALVDPQSGLLRFARDSGGANVFEYRDYHRISGGLMLPFYELRNGTTIQRYASRFDDSGAFGRPSGIGVRVDGRFAPVPLDTTFRTPVIPCSVGGIAVRCLVDSGNSGLAISSDLAKRLGAASVGAFTVTGIGAYVTDVVRAGHLRVGNAEFGDANYVVLRDIHDLGYDVVLGADFFAATTVTLDLRGISLGESEPPNPTARVPLSFAGFVPVVPVELGVFPTRLAIDTGDEGTINLSGDVLLQHPDLFRVTGTRTVVGVGGTAVEQTGKIERVRIGDLVVAEQDIAATPALRGIAPGHLGMGFLSSFGTFFDYANAALTLTSP
ncbi:MAG: pepsin/retropepsin-like aspartic protease family protein [Vulcanimicrobiaceae bacterium]